MTQRRGSGHSLRVLAGRLGEQWERERRDTLFLMGAVLLAAVPHAAHLPWWTSTGFFVFFAWRLGLVMSGRWLPRDSVRWVAALACAGAVYASYGTLVGRDAGVSLLVLFLGLKLMEMRARRDLFVVIFLCFFLLLTAFFYTQTAVTAALTVFAVLGLMATMVTMQFGLREMPLARRFRTAANLLLQAVPIAALLFLLFPRLDGPLWGLPADAHASRTGLSDTMSPGQISRLGESDEVAMRVKFEGDAPPPSAMYWRGPSFARFDGQTWTVSQFQRNAGMLPRVEPDASSLVSYAVTIEPTNRKWLFALEAPVRVELPFGNATMLADMQLVANRRVSDRLRYRVESASAFRFGANETQPALREALELPAGFNPKTLELARQWRADDDDPARLAERALQMFRRDEFRYTLTPPLLGRDGVDEFLFETRAGFCEHYAGAFVVLMRAMGVPARVVTGYQGGETNPVDGFVVVRQADAHAWAEIWVGGRGWLRVDPTAAIAPERIEFGSRRLREASRSGLGAFEIASWPSLRLNLEALANAWSQWVLSYDHLRQRKLLSSLGLGIADWRDLVGALTVGLALLLGAVALVTLRPAQPREAVDRCYDEFCRRMAVAGVERAPYETATHLLSKAERVLDAPQVRDARRIVALYNRLRYGTLTADAAQGVRHLRSLVNAFKP